METLIIYWSS